MEGDSGRGDLQAQIDELARQLAANRAAIDALGSRADKSDLRADAANHRSDQIEARALIDRDMIADLQNDGVLSREHIEQLEEALRSSRTIGAAIGLIMATRHVREDEAFAILKTASQNSNRKLREVGERTSHVSGSDRPGAVMDPRLG